MRFVRLTSAGDPRYARAMELYAASFPLHEQRSARSQAAILATEEYRFNLLYDGEKFVGILLCWETEAFFYVEHFCIFPALRNQNYGRKALDLLAGQGKPVILEIDPPEDEVSERRKGFYERCGYRVNPYPHIHPPYRGAWQGHPLVVLSRPAPLTPEQYRGFDLYLHNQVMAGLPDIP